MTQVMKHYKQCGLSKKQAQKFLVNENKKFGKEFVLFPTPVQHPNPNYKCAYRSKDYLVQVFEEPHATRLSINRTVLSRDGKHWDDNISWEELQRIKNELGYADKCAVELFPPDSKVVNVANMRHLFILNECPAFMWGNP